MSFTVRVQNYETGETEVYKNAKAVHDGKIDVCVEFHSGYVTEFDKDIYNVTVLEAVAV